MESAIFNIVYWILKAYEYCLVARVLLSWAPDVAKTRFGRLLYTITEPYLGIFRRFIPPISMGAGYMDLSPIIAFIAYYFLISGALNVLQFLFGL